MFALCVCARQTKKERKKESVCVCVCVGCCACVSERKVFVKTVQWSGVNVCMCEVKLWCFFDVVCCLGAWRKFLQRKSGMGCLFCVFC